MKLTDRMLQCKSRTAMIVPCIVHKVNINNLFERLEVVGKGFITYNSITMQIKYDLFDDDNNLLEAEYYNLEQIPEKAFLIVYSESVH